MSCVNDAGPIPGSLNSFKETYLKNLVAPKNAALLAALKTELANAERRYAEKPEKDSVVLELDTYGLGKEELEVISEYLKAEGWKYFEVDRTTPRFTFVRLLLKKQFAFNKEPLFKKRIIKLISNLQHYLD